MAKQFGSDFSLLGHNCDLNIEPRNGINGICTTLETFLTNAYANCMTEGESIIRRLRERCQRIAELRIEIHSNIRN